MVAVNFTLNPYPVCGLIAGRVLRAVSVSVATFERLRVLSEETTDQVPDWLAFDPSAGAALLRMDASRVIIATADPAYFVNLEMQVHGNQPR